MFKLCKPCSRSKEAISWIKFISLLNLDNLCVFSDQDLGVRINRRFLSMDITTCLICHLVNHNQIQTWSNTDALNVPVLDFVTMILTYFLSTTSKKMIHDGTKMLRDEVSVPQLYGRLTLWFAVWVPHSIERWNVAFTQNHRLIYWGSKGLGNQSIIIYPIGPTRWNSIHHWAEPHFLLQLVIYFKVSLSE